MARLWSKSGGMALLPAAAASGIEMRPFQPNGMLLLRGQNAALRRGFKTFSALRSQEKRAWYNGGLFLATGTWSSGLQSLKQLVGFFLGSETRNEGIRRRYLEVRVSASEDVSTSDESTFKKGMLVEILKDGKVLCAVVDRPEGKKSWIAIDQNGSSHSVRPGKVRFVVPEMHNFKQEDIVGFLKEVESVQDLSLLEIAWHELLELEESTISLVKLAKVLYGNASHVEYYATYCMLTSKQVFFRRKQKGSSVFYEPRSSMEVEELQHQYKAEEAARVEFESFISSIKSAIQRRGKTPVDWFAEKFSSSRIEALQELAFVTYVKDSHRALAKEVLEALGQPYAPEGAVEVLIGIGLLPPHVNVELRRSKIRIEFPDEIVESATRLEQEPPEDEHHEVRVDFRSMKTYTIDSDSTVEIDDGLSATELPDGRVKLWIHIADPSRLVNPDHMLDREAKQRGTTVYLPEKTIPMFPMNLAAGPMSLRQSEECCAVSVSAILNEDGSIAESSVCSSVIRPTLRLSYESATELIMLQLDEERELNLLVKAARSRYNWRMSQGAVDLSAVTIDVKVTNAESPRPDIELQVVDMASPSGRLVSEMMILCGEAVARFGNEKMLALPYRGQSETGAVEMNSTRPIPHGSLGLSGYVQFTSPIRRYTDLLAHYQVKATLCNKTPPFSYSQLDSSSLLANVKSKEAKRLSSASTRYWLIEYLRRRPRDEVYEASVVRVKDKQAIVSLKMVGLHVPLSTNVSLEPGDVVKVVVSAAQPRKDIVDVQLVEVVDKEASAFDNVVAV